MRKVALAVSVLCAVALAELLPNTAPYNKAVVLEAGRALPLEGALRLVAQAAGVPLLLGQVPEVTVKGRVQGTFREVLDLLVRVYGQDQVGYLLVGSTVVVGPKEALARLQAPKPPQGSPGPDLRYLGYGVGPGGAYGVFAVDGKVYVLRSGERLGGWTVRKLSPVGAELVREGGLRPLSTPLRRRAMRRVLVPDALPVRSRPWPRGPWTGPSP